MLGAHAQRRRAVPCKLGASATDAQGWVCYEDCTWSSWLDWLFLRIEAAIILWSAKASQCPGVPAALWRRSLPCWVPRVLTYRVAAGPLSGWLLGLHRSYKFQPEMIENACIAYSLFPLFSLDQRKKSARFWCGSRCQKAEQSLQRNGYESHFVILLFGSWLSLISKSPFPQHEAGNL